MITISNIAGFAISTINSIAFYGLNCVLKANKPNYPPSVLKNEYVSWKWRNYLISFGHSTAASLLSLCCLVVNPNLFYHVITESSDEAYLFLCFTYGYFNFDTIQMMNHFTFKGVKELIVHHLVVLMLLFVAVWKQEYVGFVCTGFLIEVNSVFLHLRQLLKLSKKYYDTKLYQTVVYLNYGKGLLSPTKMTSFFSVTLVLFRYGTVVWLIWRLSQEREKIVFGFSICLAIASICLTLVISTLLLSRLIKADLLKWKKRNMGYSKFDRSSSVDSQSS